jgi:hypothetical protein
MHAFSFKIVWNDGYCVAVSDSDALTELSCTARIVWLNTTFP